ncbi:arginine deiminase [Pontibacillus halophilus JSM 076056 = DSM 19796]|uniref:Arginine deiminase n=1 Tax=Pontibacillus halophilus JSM 076056 = DSM 19796 TaxID=1385510 RepID=A0A0A5GLL3_9BACI|nr:arginine deiminase family protein [Pontibacillus halophilus]KGX92020.1 arginine deiminase [Pontibacillus halophilus JSM 076056 = DSM 19796]
MHIQPHCWTEHGQLDVVMLCPPSNLDVPDQQTAQDVQWTEPVQQKKAKKAHERLYRALEKQNVQIVNYADYLSKEDRQLNEQLINRIFVRDLACVFGETVIPGEAGTSMRKPEYVQSHLLMKDWFKQGSFLINDNNDLKGLEYGDVHVLSKDAVLINVGIRTSLSSVEKIKDLLFKAGFSEIGIIDLPRRPDTLHLDMNCNVAAPGVFLSKSYLRFMPVMITTQDKVKHAMLADFLGRHGFEVYWVTDVNTIPDINFLCLDPETLLISTKANKKIFKSHPVLKKQKLIEVDVAELEKGGGGIRCMTLPFVRKS